MVNRELTDDDFYAWFSVCDLRADIGKEDLFALFFANMPIDFLLKRKEKKKGEASEKVYEEFMSLFKRYLEERGMSVHEYTQLDRENQQNFLNMFQTSLKERAAKATIRSAYEVETHVAKKLVEKGEEKEEFLMRFYKDLYRNFSRYVKSKNIDKDGLYTMNNRERSNLVTQFLENYSWGETPEQRLTVKIFSQGLFKKKLEERLEEGKSLGF